MKYLKKLSNLFQLTMVASFVSLLFLVPVSAGNPSAEAACAAANGTWNGTTCVVTPPPAAASSTAKEAACQGSGGTWDPGSQVCSSPDGRTVTGTLQQVINILIFIVGAIAVIMVVIGAIRYTVAQGDQAAVTGAKNTILYAIVGVVLAFAAYGIVNFVVIQF